MTNDDLNQLFASAREIPVETAPEQVANWVGVAAATGTGALGLAAKLKLFIAKKTFLFMGTIFSVASLGVIVTMSLSSADAPKETESTKKSISVVGVDTPQEEKKLISVTTFDDTTREEPKPPVPPAPPAPDVNAAAVAPVLPEIPSPEPLIKPELPQVPAAPHKADNKKPELPKVPKPPKAKAKNKGKRGSIKGNGEVIKQERSVQPFSEIQISGVFDVILKQGSKEGVSVETDSNLQECIIVENEGNSLVLSNSKTKIKKSTKMIVYVTVKDLTKLKDTGVGDIKSENTLKANTLELVLSNVGDMSLNIESQDLNMRYSGVGDVKLTGVASNSTMNVSGVGDISAYDLQVKTMDIRHTGVGDARIHVTESLKLDFKGVGDVFYKGNPKEKDISKGGVGSVKAKS